MTSGQWLYIIALTILVSTVASVVLFSLDLSYYRLGVRIAAIVLLLPLATVFLWGLGVILVQGFTTAGQS
jgi:hypothetical protein